MTPGFSVILLLLSCIGHTELWVIATNRMHARALHRRRLRQLRVMHDLAIVLFPPFIVWRAGFASPGLLQGGEFIGLAWPVRWLLTVTWGAAVFFLLGVARWHLRRDPRRANHGDSRSYDLLDEAESDEARRDILGTPKLLSQLPFNEIFRLEVNEKRLKIYPHHQVRASLRIAHFSDMHLLGAPGVGYQRRVIAELLQMRPDAYMFTGDLLDEAEQLSFALELLKPLLEVAPGYFILGNHDQHLDHHQIRREVAATGWKNLGGQSLEAEIGGVSTRLAGTETPWIGVNPQVPSRQSEQLRLLLSHAPDQCEYAASNDFDVMLCGHNHGGQIVLPLIGPVYSPSRFGVCYAGGVFEYRGTLMHVSRGTGAMDAVRWNCQPEITLLHIDV